MAYLHFDSLGVAALAGAVPDFIQVIPQDADHPRAAYIKNFVRQTGVRQRHISITEQTATDYAFAALKAALDRAGWDAQSLDGLIFLTQTPDFNAATGNSFLLHKHLGMREEALVFDIAQGCASFPYGLGVCAGFLQQPGINRMAMLCGDTMWPAYPDKESLLQAPTFLIGEGSTAILLEKKANSPVDLALYSDGAGYHFLYDPWSGARHAWRRVPGIMPNGALYEGGPYMDGMEITTFSTMRVVGSIQQFLQHLGKTVADYDGVVLHQANMQILKTMARRLKVAPENFPTTVETLANTNGASVLLTAVDAYAGRKGPLNLLISAFGIGLSWGIVSLALDADVIVPLIQCQDRFEEDFLKPVENADS